MGDVYKYNQGLLKDYPAQQNSQYTEAVINPGQTSAPVSLAAFSRKESERLLLKLDALCSQLNNPLIGVIVAENAEAIMVAARMCKDQAKGEFAGILAAGTMLDMKWLRPKDIGGKILSPATTSATGLWGGTGQAVYTWLETVAANAVVGASPGAGAFVPSQTMEQFASVIHLGAIDPIQVPKITDIVFTLGGVATPYQSVNQNIKKSIGDAANDIQVTRFEKPIIVGPLQSQAIVLQSGPAGDTNFQLLSLIIARAQEFNY
jgi:hypothetical protein